MSAPTPRVLFVTSPFGWGGAEKHLEDFIARVHPGHLEAEIVSFAPNGYAAALLRKGVTGVGVYDATASTFLGYRRLFRAHSPDVVVFVNGKLDLFPRKAYAAARVSGARRVVGIEHTRGPEPPPPAARGGLLGPVRAVLGWRARHIMRIRTVGYLCHRTISVSRGVRQTLVNGYGYPPDRTVTVLNGIDVQYFRPSVRSKGAAKSILGLAWENQVVVCVAWLGGLKRIDVLLQAIALLRPKRPSLRCLIVGGGPLADALLVQRDTLGLSNEVVFTGHHEDVRPFLEAGDVYVSTSEREGFGLALVEAMAFELPCVATNIGGHDEILSRPGTGVLVAPGDAEGVATQIEYLLDQPAESKAMGVAARGEVEARFNIDRMVAQLLDVLLGEK